MIVVVVAVTGVDTMYIDAADAAAEFYLKRALVFEQIFDCADMRTQNERNGRAC